MFNQMSFDKKRLKVLTLFFLRTYTFEKEHNHLVFIKLNLVVRSEKLKLYNKGEDKVVFLLIS